MEVLYKPQVHNGHRTMEQQMLLLAKAATHAWESWCDREKQPSVQGIREDFDIAMRNVYRVVEETDIFMGGVAEARRIEREQER